VEASPSAAGRVRVVVATTVLLSFISFWRAAAIVLSDLGSTAFYVGGIVEQAIGKAAPWFVLGVMLFSYAVRALYIESSAMFVRAGVYRVVKEAMGGTLAKLSVSALLFDYVLTGPISGVSAGRYIAGLSNELLARGRFAFHLPDGLIASIIAVLITVYFWWRNTKGLRESSDDALRIMKVTTVMVAILIVWCLITVLQRGGKLPPAPVPSNLTFSSDALGWLKGTIWPTFTAVAILVGFGHSILAMSGEESLAQVYREIEHPKVKNLQRAGTVIFVYSLVFTALVSFLAVALIPDDVRPRFYDNLISGLAMNLSGPENLRLFFQAFVVVVGSLILAGAANTAIVGANGVLNRVAEDGVLTDWFRKPHKRFGTSYRLINLIVILQIVTILLSRGDVFVLGEAYAFGVIWSFAFKAISVLILRFRQPDAPRPWRVPFNPRIAGHEVPVGLIGIAIVLVASAIVNLLTKETATLAGVSFTGAFFVVFWVSERVVERRRAADATHLDHFQLDTEREIGLEGVGCREGNVLVPVRDYKTLAHLDWVLGHSDSDGRDVVVITVRLVGQGLGALGVSDDQIFSDYEQRLFTKVVAVAERHGRRVSLLVTPGTNVFDALTQSAARLRSAFIVVGESGIMTPEQQAHQLGAAWDRAPHHLGPATRLVVWCKDGRVKRFALGAHSPELPDSDIERIHSLWVELVGTVGTGVHHRDVVAVALSGLEAELRGEHRAEALDRLRRHMERPRQ
jgi:amino acid transporter